MYVRMYVCVRVYMCMRVHSYLPPHTLESQKRDSYQRVHNNTGRVSNFAAFPKHSSFKNYAYLEQLRCPSASPPTKYAYMLV